MRCPSKRSALSAYEQQRAHVKGRDDNESRLLTHDGRINQTILLTGHLVNEFNEAPLHKIFVSYELLRGKDSGEIPILFRDNLNDINEDIIPNNTDDVQPQDDFIESLIEGLSAAEAQGKLVITLHSTELYLFEFYRIFKVGGIASPLAPTPISSGREYRYPRR